MVINLSIQSVTGLDKLSLLEKLAFVHEKYSRLVDGFEILLSPDFVCHGFHSDKKDVEDLLSYHPYNTFHLNGPKGIRFGDNDWTRRCIEIAAHFFAAGRIRQVVVHPDQIDDMAFLNQLAIASGVRIGIEIMGAVASVGNSVSDIEKILTDHTGFDLVADTAHIAEQIPFGQPSLETYADRFSGRLKQIHFSAPGNFYTDIQTEEKIQTPHSLVSLRWQQIDDFLPCFHKVKHLPFTIEGVVPRGEKAESMLKNEIELIRRAS